LSSRKCASACTGQAVITTEPRRQGSATLRGKQSASAGGVRRAQPAGVMGGYRTFDWREGDAKQLLWNKLQPCNQKQREMERSSMPPREPSAISASFSTMTGSSSSGM